MIPSAGNLMSQRTAHPSTCRSTVAPVTASHSAADPSELSPLVVQILGMAAVLAEVAALRPKLTQSQQNCLCDQCCSLPSMVWGLGLRLGTQVVPTEAG